MSKLDMWGVFLWGLAMGLIAGLKLGRYWWKRIEYHTSKLEVAKKHQKEPVEDT